ncbi:MAG TPA: glycoside hydrolase family 95 protein, partial [Longimicrobiales bacterium]
MRSHNLPPASPAPIARPEPAAPQAPLAHARAGYRPVGAVHASGALGLALLLVASGAAGLRAQARQPRLLLRYDHPAAEWIEALPLGNGRLGAMVFGGIARERIQFNEATLWSGGPHDYDHPGAAAVLPELRSLLLAGKQAAADSLASARFMSIPLQQMAYQAFGDIHLTFPGLEGADSAVTAYGRQLDLDSALATTRFRRGATTYTRQVFASYPAGVVVVRLSADRPGQVSVSASLSSAHAGALRHALPGDQLSLSGGVEGGAIRYEARLLVRASGGRVGMSDTLATVTGADAVTLVLAAATNYVSYDDVSGDPVARNDRTVSRLGDVAFPKLLADHEGDYRALFRRVSLDLGASAPAVAALSTDERIARFAAQSDPGLVTLLFQYGRYLLIASSRAGGQPANLQGLWNDSNTPPWGSKYTVNINTEMNYWPAEVTNLAECHQPLLRFIGDLAKTGAVTAQHFYGCGGWCVHHNSDIWALSNPVGNFGEGSPTWANWPMGGAWLSLHLWEHFAFDGDEAWLRSTGYPLMKGAAQFLLDWLVEGPDGFLVTAPSTSPENEYKTPDGYLGAVSVMTTADLAITRALFDKILRATGVLHVDPDFRTRVKTALDRLPPYKVGRKG